MLLGKLDKMKLQAYSDERFSKKKGQPFSVLINPESYTIHYRIEHSENQGQGTSHPQLHFNKIKAQDIHFDFVFDSSGVVVDPAVVTGGAISLLGEASTSVIDKIEAFKALMLNYQSEIHRPNFVALNWGTLLFKGQLTSMDVEYKLFKPDGTPIRAIVKADFRGYVEDDLRVALENSLSPDITHERRFNVHDRLPLMVDEMYDSPNYYVEVAKANGLTSFRKITTGTKLFFPPVKK